jgi:ubiquinone/menaquinone biosynthesis C-methylase UbiE
MEKEQSEHLGAFTNIDASDEPQKWQHILDYLSAMPEVIGWRKIALQGLNLKDGMTVLDVGCGLGDTTRAIGSLISPSGTVIGLDVSQAMIDVAKKRSDHSNENYRTGDVTQLDFADNTFDAIHIERVLHHVKDAEKGLKELYRVLKPGGRLCLFEPNFSSCAISPLPESLVPKLAQQITKAVQHGDIGLHLLEIAKKLHMTELNFRGLSLSYRDFALIDSIMHFTDLLNNLQETKTDQYIADMRKADQLKTFVFTIPCYQLIAAK